MSDSEDEFASADEGETSSGKTTSITRSKQSEPKPEANPEDQVKKNTTKNESAAKSSTQDTEKSESTKSKHLPTSGVSKSEDKPGSKSKGKNSKQKRKQANKNKKEAAEDVKDEEEKEPSVKNRDDGVEKQTENSETDDKTVTTTSSDAGTSSKVSTNKTDQAVTAQQLSLDSSSTNDSEQDISTSKNERVSIEVDSRETETETPREDVHDQTMDRGDSTLQDTDSPSKTDTEVKQDTGQKQSSSGWGGWSSWGSSIVNVASASVSTFTSQVGEGFSTVLETVESSLGAPPPEQLAQVTQAEGTDGKDKGEGIRDSNEKSDLTDSQSKGDNQESAESKPAVDHIEKDKKDESQPEKSEGGGWLSSWGVSNLTHLVSDTGKTLVSGSLDVLETIGKKTYDALSEHDPGLKAAIKGDNKPNLSSMLREAKDQAAERSKMEEEFAESRQAHFGAMFDEYQGLAHLEALEMLSNQSETKVQSLLMSLSSDARESVKHKLLEIKAIFELEELDDEDDEIDQDFPKLISDNLSEFHSGTSPAKLNSVQAKVLGWFTNFSKADKETVSDPKEIHKVSIQSLAELTAKTVEQYHKAGELLLLQSDQKKEMVDRAKSLASVTRVVCTEVGIISSKFTKCLNKVAENLEDSESINTFITNVFLEASNSSTYIQDAFQLLLPVVQQAVIQETQGNA